jgi:subtilisin family serine protease
MPIKIIAKDLNGNGTASDVAILYGFKYITMFRLRQGTIRVANSSFGKYSRSRSIAMLVNILKSSPYEVLVIGAASNDDSMARSYPAAFSDAIAVSAIGPDDGKASYSNFGPWVDIAAPGGDAGRGLNDIRSTVPGGGADFKRGTSMASPVVAGVAGLVLAADPNRSFSALRASLINTADPRIYVQGVYNGINYNYYFPRPEGDTSRLPLLGSGVVDAEAALDGTKKTGISQSVIGRVDGSCGVIQSVQVAKGLTWLWLIAPVVLIGLTGGSRRGRR